MRARSKPALRVTPGRVAYRLHSRPVRRTWLLHLLLVAPFVGTLWVPFYNAVEPSIAGVPYFYWYQFLWIALGAGLTAIVYFATGDEDS